MSLESTKCHLNQQSVKLLIERSQFASVSKCWPSWITQQTSRITGHIIFPPLALNLSPTLNWYMTMLQVRKLCEYSNPEIAFEYSYEMRIFEHSNIRWHPYLKAIFLGHTVLHLIGISHTLHCKLWHKKHVTPQPLYNTIAWIQTSFRVSYPIRVITRVKCIDI